MTFDVAIVGAGISGLAAAYELSRRGVSFVVLEASSRPGGLILSEEIDGFVVDAGPDSLLTQKPAAIELCQEIGLGPRLIATKPPRIAYIQRGGRLHALPAASVLGVPTRVGPFLRTSLFSWSGKLRMGAELFVPRRRDGADESIGAFMTRRFGAEASAYLAEPLLAGIHAGDVDRLSVTALFPRFVEAERTHGSLIRAFRSQSNPSQSNPSRSNPSRSNPSGSNPQPPIPNPEADGAFRSLPGGLSELVCGLVRTIGGERVRTGTAVAAIAGTGPFQVRTPGGETVDARSVVLTTPAGVTGSLFAGRDRDLESLCAGVRYVSVATVALAFDRGAIAHPLNGSGFVVPRTEHSGVLAASWLSSKWPGRAAEGRALLRTFIGGARDPEAIRLDDETLVERSLSSLRPLLGITGAPLFARVYRWPRANAQHEVGHLDRVAAIDGALTRHPGLFVTGSGFRGVGIPDCVADARRTAAAAAAWLAAV